MTIQNEGPGLGDEQSVEDIMPSTSCCVVGIGSSAGGVAALTELFTALPPTSGMAFVVVTHLSSKSDSHLHEVIAKCTDMAVVSVRGNTQIEPDKVYVLASNMTVRVNGTMLEVEGLGGSPAPRGVIDRFLRGLAEGSRENAVGVLLSGSNTDGTVGLQEIKRRGGLTLVQSPDSAQYAAMPRSAISAGVVDDALKPAEIADRLVRHAATLSRVKVYFEQQQSSPLSDTELLDEICRIVTKATQHDFRLYKRSTLTRRVCRRMLVLQTPTMRDYVEALASDPEEPERLFKDLLISVTAFFRDRSAFDALATQIKEYVQEEDREQLRIWVPGCATGEEAYSIAMLIDDAIRTRDHEIEVQIFATDIDEEAIRTARAGSYPRAIEKQVPSEFLERYFRSFDDRYEVEKSLRDMCIFSVHSLVSDPPFSHLDLVSCRNVLIYMESELQQRIIQVMHYALEPYGLLFLGSADNLGASGDLFRPIDAKHHLFCAKEAPRRLRAAFPPMLAMGEHTGGDGLVTSPKPSPLTELTRRFQERLLEDHGPAAALVDGGGRVLYFSGRLGKFLEHRSGPVEDDIISLARRELRLHLRSALHKARTSRRIVVVEDLLVEFSGQLQSFTLQVSPFEAPGETLWSVLFRESGQPQVATPEAERPAALPEQRLAQQLEQELERTREHLSSTIAQLETANEEMKSSNEELLSMNEELHSSNEELQTSQEELQSVNEELETVNSELHVKIQEVDRAHADLQNLFESSRVPTLFLDRHGRIKQFTPAAQELFRLIDADLGRPVVDIALRLKGIDLRAEIADVLRTLTPRDRKVLRVLEEGESRTYLVRISPYRTVSDVIDGAVLSFVDITELEQAAERLRARGQQQAAVANLGMRALSEHSVESTLQEVVQEVCETLGLQRFGIFELQPEGDFVLRTGRGFAELDAGEVLRVPGGRRSLLGHPLAVNAAVVSNDVAEDPRFDGDFLRSGPVVSSVCCVIPEAEGPFGVVAALESKPRNFSEDDANFLVAVANVVATVLGRRRRLDVIQERERQLRLQLSELNILYENSPVGLGVVDPDLRLVRANGILAEMLGAEQGTVLERRLPEFLQDGAHEEFETVLRALLHSGGTVMGREIWSHPQGAPGARCWLCNFATMSEPDGGVREVAISIVDVTKQKAHEEALRASEAQVRSLVDTIPVLIWVSEEGDYVQFNRGWADFVGGAERWSPHDVEEAIHPDDRKSVNELHHQAMRDHRPFETEFRLRHNDGTYHWVSERGRPWNDPRDGRVRYVAVSFDIDSQKRHERALQHADELKDEFLAMLGHELRNPLTAIRASVDVLRSAENSGDAMKRVDDILDRQTAQMGRLIDGLLDVSRLQRGMMSLQFDTVDVRRLLQATLLDFAASIERAGLEVGADVAPGAVWVCGDEVRLLQVFGNLLSNAIKFTPPGGKLSVEQHLEGDRVCIRFCDSGVGIEESIREDVFEPFRQAPQTIARSRGGLGLGLPLVRGLIEKHDGTVCVVEPDGKWSTIIEIELPTCPPPASQARPKAAPRRAGRVLIVEDAPDIAEVLTILVQQLGAEAKVAIDGVEALEMVESYQPEVVLCDIGLPGEHDGVDVARILRERQDGSSLKLIAMTGYGDRDTRGRALEAGFDEFLLKPLSREVLAEVLSPREVLTEDKP